MLKHIIIFISFATRIDSNDKTRDEKKAIKLIRAKLRFWTSFFIANFEITKPISKDNIKEAIPKTKPTIVEIIEPVISRLSPLYAIKKLTTDPISNPTKEKT